MRGVVVKSCVSVWTLRGVTGLLTSLKLTIKCSVKSFLFFFFFWSIDLINTTFVKTRGRGSNQDWRNRMRGFTKHRFSLDWNALCNLTQLFWSFSVFVQQFSAEDPFAGEELENRIHAEEEQHRNSAGQKGRGSFQPERPRGPSGLRDEEGMRKKKHLKDGSKVLLASEIPPGLSVSISASPLSAACICFNNGLSCTSGDTDGLDVSGRQHMDRKWQQKVRAVVFNGFRSLRVNRMLFTTQTIIQITNKKKNCQTTKTSLILVVFLQVFVIICHLALFSLVG